LHLGDADSLSDLGLGHFMEETHDQNVAVAYRERGQVRGKGIGVDEPLETFVIFAE
jgi:hypothetical protein